MADDSQLLFVPFPTPTSNSPFRLVLPKNGFVPEVPSASGDRDYGVNRDRFSLQIHLAADDCVSFPSSRRYEGRLPD
jgi:hypothetical protein